MNINPFRSIKRPKHRVASSPLLSGLNTLQIVEFFHLCHERRFQEGEFIYYRNDPGSGIYFIEEGRVALTLPPDAVDDAHDTGIRVQELEAPHHFGELSVASERRRLTSARALEPCRLFGFFQSDYETLKQREPTIALLLMEALTAWQLQTLDRMAARLESAIGLEETSKIRYSHMGANENEEVA